MSCGDIAPVIVLPIKSETTTRGNALLILDSPNGDVDRLYGHSKQLSGTQADQGLSNEDPLRILRRKQMKRHNFRQQHRPRRQQQRLQLQQQVGTFRVMQQKAFEESRYPWQESLENVAVCLPFRCPRCGDHTRFRSLSSLRAHLEFSHSYQERTLLTKCSLFPSLRDTDLVTSSEPLKQGKLQSCGNVVKQKPSYVNLYSVSHEHSKDRKPFEVVAERPVSYVQTYTAVDLRADSLDGPRSSPGLPTPDTKASFEAHIREKFNRMVEAVDRTIEKRIDKLTKDLAHKTAELLEVRAAFVQLTQKKQEVQRRERALNRQVEVAVEMIAVLRQRLTESEEELLRKEEEVVTFNHFLEAATEKEVQGKARLQDFIENLLQRVELAEKQLEYYQSQRAAGLGQDISEHVNLGITRCGHGFIDERAHFLDRDRMCLQRTT
ncbi:hypothetical protein HPG69_009249 [Diceros bicornis minor]|uniref:FBX41/ZN365 C2H2-type zinc finger domain-containing protein n=1 Tax=Diceros bicornis minor TaxID=77932 RepID=A0A7J7FIK0_DICBM|nr:hypothetical protein HPG69_009249 [Diceros bicornis minor]